jgi:two-component system cell cycle sensor histidine kinase/response regulator CckA
MKSEQGLVLVVDDNETNRDVLALRLKRAGYDVAMAENGYQALEMMRAQEFDLMLLDIIMPEMDGYQVLEHLKADPVLCHIPVIVISVLDDLSSVVKCIELGAEDHLSKPFNQVLLKARIGATLEKKRLRAQEQAYLRLQLENEKAAAEEALRGSEERYLALFERVPVGLYRSTPDGDLLEANLALLQMMGFSDRQAFAKVNTIDSYIDPEDRKRFRALMERRGAVRNFEAQLRRSDGVPIWVKVDTLAVSDADGQVLYYEGSMEDITERKRIEAQLRQQERLAAIGQLVGGIAHDFNNLMATIMLCAQMSMSRPDLHLDVVRHLETILAESRRAAKLVQQMLDFGRRSVIDVRPINLESFSKDVFGVLRRALAENIRFTLDVQDAGQGDYIVEADPICIQQVLMNLALNAQDAMPDGGKLHIGLSRVELRPDEKPPMAALGMPFGEWICLVVSDTGTGMTEEVQAHLFEPFFTTKEPGAGTGLGLAQVYGIVKQHKGHIDVETAVGEGTTFRIYLPVYEGEGMEKVNKPSALL